ncbi:MAG: hypothetical protein J6L88_05680 [Clostridia bacterium]|nr:hypothetical protein [Clostridia bacterium]
MTNEQIVTALKDTESRSKSNTHRIDRMEERQDNLDKLVSSVSVMAEKQERMEGDIGEIKTDVKALAGVPARRWETVADKFLMALVGALTAYMLNRIGIL